MSHYVPNTRWDGTQKHTLCYITYHFSRPSLVFSLSLNSIDILTPIATPWMKFFKCRWAIYKPNRCPSLPWYNKHIFFLALNNSKCKGRQMMLFRGNATPSNGPRTHQFEHLGFFRMAVLSGKPFPSTWFEAYYRYLKSQRLHFHYIYLESRQDFLISWEHHQS